MDQRMMLLAAALFITSAALADPPQQTPVARTPEEAEKTLRDLLARRDESDECEDKAQKDLEKNKTQLEKAKDDLKEKSKKLGEAVADVATATAAVATAAARVGLEKGKETGPAKAALAAAEKKLAKATKDLEKTKTEQKDAQTKVDDLEKTKTTLTNTRHDCYVARRVHNDSISDFFNRNKAKITEAMSPADFARYLRQSGGEAGTGGRQSDADVYFGKRVETGAAVDSRTQTIKSGDTIGEIAQRMQDALPNGKKAPLWGPNGLVEALYRNIRGQSGGNPNLIIPGQTIDVADVVKDLEAP